MGKPHKAGVHRFMYTVEYIRMLACIIIMPTPIIIIILI